MQMKGCRELMFGENQYGVVCMDTHPGVVCLISRAERMAALTAEALLEVKRVISG